MRLVAIDLGDEIQSRSSEVLACEISGCFLNAHFYSQISLVCYNYKMGNQKQLRVGIGVLSALMMLYGIVLLVLGIIASTSYDDYYYYFYSSYIFIILGVFSILSGIFGICFVTKPTPGFVGTFVTYAMIALFVGFIHIIIFATIYGVFYWFLIIGAILHVAALFVGCNSRRGVYHNPNQQAHLLHRPPQQHIYINYGPGYPPPPEAQFQAPPGYAPQQYVVPPQHMAPPQPGYYPQNAQYVAVGGQVPPNYQPGPPQVIQGQPIPGQVDAPPEPKETKTIDQ